MIPTKEEFLKCMNYIIRKDEAESKMCSIMSEYSDVYIDGILPIDAGVGIIIDLLEKLFELPVDEMYGTTLSWWMYEKDYGKNFKVIDLEYTNIPEDHKLRKPDLSSLDNLYDCLMLEWNAGNNVSKKYS